MLEVLDVNNYGLQSMVATGGGGEVNLQSKDVTINQNGTTTITADQGYDGLSDVDVTVDVIKPKLYGGIKFDISSTTNADWLEQVDTSNLVTASSMFYKCAQLTSLPLFDTSNITKMDRFCQDCTNIVTIPPYDTSNVNYFSSFAYRCTSLENVPVLNFSKITTNTEIQSMFNSCTALSNESLNNIMASCITATSYTGRKTLQNIGLTSEQAETCQTLSNWDAFVAAGWSTGYES